MGYSLAALAVLTWQDKFLVLFGLVCIIVVMASVAYNILAGAYKRAVEDKAKLPPPGPHPTRISPPPPKLWTPGVGVTCPKCGHRC